jgi:hypothetical protein
VEKLWVQSIDARAASRNLLPGDIISLELAAITPEFYRFLDAIKKDEQGTDPLFSGPPANIIGNINNGALGMFTFISQRLLRWNTIRPNTISRHSSSHQRNFEPMM